MHREQPSAVVDGARNVKTLGELLWETLTYCANA